ncbi:MAG: dicarboxylate/amino acid:cation symporter, partial [Myxococcales bacterium]|nr:dicarboxylate/amino acid:cation symporter [Myxococcales bacterium]
MKRFPLYAQILVAMVLGAVLGLALNAAQLQGSLDRSQVLLIGGIGEKAGQLFLALLNMVVVPLIFASLVGSITGLKESGGDLKRLGTRTVAYYLLTSALAIGTGILAVNLVQPGQGLEYDALMAAAQGELAALGKSAPDVSATASGGALGVLADIVFRMVPPNIVDASSSNRNILSVIFFAVCFGVAALQTGGPTLERIDALADAVFRTMITLTNGILHFAPVGIFGYILFVTSTTGLSLAMALLWYMVAVALALAVHAFVTLPGLYALATGKNPLQYAAAMRDALLTAFSTASSSGTLPLTMRCATENAKIPARVTSFTLPLGSTVNMDGTALYEAVAVLFVAQMRGGLDLQQQVVVAVTALLASVGAAGIPHAGTVMMVIVMG